MRIITPLTFAAIAIGRAVIDAFAPDIFLAQECGDPREQAGLPRFPSHNHLACGQKL